MAAPREIEKLESQYHGNPEGTAFAPLANAHRKLGDPERAIEILHAGLVHHPEYAPARIVLGRCNVDRGDDAAAEMEFIRVLELDEENVIALQALADIAERDARYQDSEGWLNTLLSLDAGNERAREQLARVVAAASVGLPADPPVDEAQPVEYLETAAPFEDSSVEEVAGLPGLEPTEPFDVEPPVPAVEELGMNGEMELEAVELPADLEPLPDLEVSDLEEAQIIGGEVGSVEAESMAGGGVEAWDLESAEPAVEELGVIGGEAEDREIIGEDEPPEVLGESMEAAAAGSEPGDTAWDEPSIEVEEEEGEQEGDETPAVLSELVFEEDFVIGLPEEEPAETPASVDAEHPPFEEATPFAMAAEPEAVFPEGLAEGGVEEPEPEPEPEPETVATETMAELYLSQGHRLEALGIYRLLLAQQPDDVRLEEKVAALEEEDRRPAPARDSVPSDYAATSRGGQSLSDFFRVLLASRPDSEPPHAVESPPTEEGERLEGAEPREAPSPTAGGSLGEPTRPAHDRLLLSSVFGEDTSPVPPAIRSLGGVGSGTSTGRFSFDAFFGGQRGESVQPPEASSGKTQVEEEDLDQFQAWLQSLKG
jgi:tetratricopeptide (TPR) repeat protein